MGTTGAPVAREARVLSCMGKRGFIRAAFLGRRGNIEERIEHDFNFPLLPKRYGRSRDCADICRGAGGAGRQHPFGGSWREGEISNRRHHGQYRPGEPDSFPCNHPLQLHSPPRHRRSSQTAFLPL